MALKQSLRAGCLLIAALASPLDAQDSGEPKFPDGGSTVVVIPDTEGYTAKNPETFHAMMKWVAENRSKRRIDAILHVGDITNNNTAREWRAAREAFDLVEGRIPYVLAAGNHDYDNTPGRLTHLNDYFPLEDQRRKPEFGDVFEAGKLENHYQFPVIQGRKWLVLSLEMGPRQAVIDWANEVLARHREIPAIILTHAYLYYDNQRYNHHHGRQRATPHGFYGEGADGEELWNGLVRIHPNVMIVVCGHLSSGYVGYRADEADYGNVVHQMMVDYEKMKGGGQGFLRLLEFLPDRKTVQVRTYSPVTGGRNPRDPALEEFTFELQPATRSEPRRLAATPGTPLSRGPVHRYSFGGAPGQEIVPDLVGRRDAKLAGDAALDGSGRLVLTGDGAAQLPDGLLTGRDDLSVELWFTPTASSYKWSAPVRLGSRDDWFTYVFRTLDTHRAEIAVDRHNEDIQQSVPVVPGKAMHILISYDHDGADGKPQLAYFRDGELRGRLATGLELSDVSEDQNRLGPFEGTFDELRLYDYPLTPAEVANNFNAGPDDLVIEKSPGKPD